MKVQKYQFVIYIVILLTVISWCAGILIAPLWNNAPGTRGAISGYIYEFYSVSCHQDEGRSLFLNGSPLGLCSRCTSIYFAFLISSIVYPFVRKLNNLDLPSIVYLAIGAGLVGIDAGLGLLDVIENTFISREITGAILGLVLPFYIIPGTIRVYNEFFKSPIKNAAK